MRKKYKNLYKNTLSSQLFFITSNAQSVITMFKKKTKTRNQEKAEDGGDISLSQHHL